jgi:hypothetical protein
MRRSVAFLAALTISGSVYVHAQPVKGVDKVSVDMTIIEASGTTLAERKIEARLGTTEAVFVQQQNRTISVDATINPGTRPGCYKIDLVVRDRTIDASGRFGKTVWQSGTEPCDPQPITLGPKEEVRVRVAVKPSAVKPPVKGP